MPPDRPFILATLSLAAESLRIAYEACAPGPAAQAIQEARVSLERARRLVEPPDPRPSAPAGEG